MNRIAKHASRLLAGTVVGSPDTPVFPQYVSFSGTGRPPWWKHTVVSAEWGEILGVHELFRGERHEAFIVTDRGLVLLRGQRDAEWIPYERITGWDPPPKQDAATALKLHTDNGVVFLRFLSGGSALAFIQFLLSAIRERDAVLRRE